MSYILKSTNISPSYARNSRESLKFEEFHAYTIAYPSRFALGCTLETASSKSCIVIDNDESSSAERGSLRALN